jgi:ABC-type phosphate transport system substrate-binding protein
MWHLAVPSFTDRAESLVLRSGLVQTILTTFVAVLITWAVTSFQQRKRLTWRDYLDAPVNLDPQQASRVSSWKILCQGEEVEDPSLVLLRLRNAGLVEIADEDFTSVLEFSFPGRQIRGSDIIECNGEDEYKVLPLANREAAVGQERIKLDRFSMNRGDRITLLFMLSGSAQGVQVDGHVHGGGRRNIIHEPPRRGPATRTLIFGGAATLLFVGLLSGIFLATGTRVPSACIAGRLTLEGSTAFAPAARQIGRAYRGSCHSANISVVADGTFAGLQTLAGAGTQAAASQVAISDGPAPSGYPALLPHPVGVIVFTVVVNKQTGVFRLTTHELREIYQGAITNWRQLGGADLPIRIVSRDAESGTRRAFDQKVLGGPELNFSSYDCVHKNADPSSPVVSCQEPSTTTLLRNVAAIPGAIGYAETSDVDQFGNANIQSVEIDGLGADIGAVGNGPGHYHFWTVEYLYSYGTPPGGSLAAAFIHYMNSYAAKDILRSEGYIPCSDQGLSQAVASCHQ